MVDLGDVVDSGVRQSPTAAFLRPSTTRPLVAALPLDVKPDAGDEAARLAPARLFSPTNLGKTDDFSAGPRAGDLGDFTSVTRAPRSRAPVMGGSMAMVAAADGAAIAEEFERRGEFLDRARELLIPGGTPTDSRFGASASDATYDFDEYVLLRDAVARGGGGSGRGGAEVLFDPRFTALRNEARNGIAGFLDYAMLALTGLELQEAQANAGPLRELLLSFWTTYCGVRASNRLARYARADVAAATGGLSPEVYYGQCLGFWLSSMAADEATEYLISDGASGLETQLTQAFWLQVLDAVFDAYFANIPAAAGPQADGVPYGFDPFPTDEVLFGVRVIHRQTWRLLGYARGELVKSIPLGPRESQKVSVRILRRRRAARTSEEATSYETSQEAGQTTKDTAEVVSEASEKTAKSLSAEASGGYGPFFQARISGSLSSEVAASSRDTNSRLNEKMQKTASRMKRDTKVTVSTEFEEIFEENRSSELVNPNDEVAVTYLYHRLQQRHWVTTEVGEVHSVVFVPEPLPVVIDEAWVRQHADAIAGALLDPAFAPLVEAIRSEPPKLPRTDLDPFDAALQAGITAIRDYRTFSGSRDLPDMLGSGQAAYERQIDRHNGFDVDEARRKYQSDALFDHIRRNLLHYLRTIILEEDRDRRTQRLSRLLVPTQWTFVPSGPLPPVGPATPSDVQGEFRPVVGSERPVSEVIDPTGPIGFLLNCAVYRLRDEPRLANLHEALAYLRSQYMRFEATVDASNPSAPNLIVRQTLVHTPRTFLGGFRLVYRQNRGEWLLPVSGRAEQDWPPAAARPNGALDILGVMLWVDGQPADGATLTVRVSATGQLEDPHMKLVRMQSPLPAAQNEASVFFEVLQREMATIVPELEGSGAAVGPWAGLTEAQREMYRRYYHRYLMLRDAGRLVPLDTANLVLELEVSRTPALEPFKRLHRYVDAVNAHEESLRRALDNHRRGGLLGQGELADPDIERVTVIAGGGKGSLVVLPAEGGEDEAGEGENPEG